MLPEPRISNPPEVPQVATNTVQASEDGSTIPEHTTTSMDMTDDTHQASGEIDATRHENTTSHDEESVKYAGRLTKLKKILSGETPIHLTLQFLYGHNR